MKKSHSKHDIEQTVHDPNVLGKIVDILEEQILQHFKESLPLKIESQLLKIDDIDVAIFLSQFCYCCESQT